MFQSRVVLCGRGLAEFHIEPVWRVAKEPFDGCDAAIQSSFEERGDAKLCRLDHQVTASRRPVIPVGVVLVMSKIPCAKWVL